MSISENNFRVYDCNIQCPMMYANKIGTEVCEINEATIEKLKVDSFSISDVHMYYGSSSNGSVHMLTTTTLPVLANLTFSGDLTFYLNSDAFGTYSDKYVNITMAAVVGTRNSILQAVIYQNVGNFNSVSLTIDNKSLVLTVDPPAICKWVYRGL